MEYNSILKFTNEIGHTDLAYLDINTSLENQMFATKVYVKSVDEGDCLNYGSQ